MKHLHAILKGRIPAEQLIDGLIHLGLYTDSDFSEYSLHIKPSLFVEDNCSIFCRPTQLHDETLSISHSYLGENSTHIKIPQDKQSLFSLKVCTELCVHFGGDVILRSDGPSPVAVSYTGKEVVDHSPEAYKVAARAFMSTRNVHQARMLIDFVETDREDIFKFYVKTQTAPATEKVKRVNLSVK